jgi:hypothetical protein
VVNQRKCTPVLSDKFHDNTLNLSTKENRKAIPRIDSKKAGWNKLINDDDDDDDDDDKNNNNTRGLAFRGNVVNICCVV